MFKRLFFVTVLTLCFSVYAFAASPVRYEPYDIMFAPSGTNFAFAYFMWGASSDMYVKNKKQPAGADMESNIGLFRLGTFREIAGLPIEFMLVLPYGNIKVDTPAGGSRSSGLGDAEWNLIVQPWNWGSGFINLAFVVTSPTGEYQYDSAVNLGANRWAFRPMFMGQQSFFNNRFAVSFISGCDFFTDNDKFGDNKDDLEKDPEYWAEIHMTYVVQPESNTYFGLSLGGLWGGKEELKNTTVTNKGENYAVKASFGRNITPSTLVTFNYLQDLKVEDGFKAKEFGFRVGYFF